MRLETGQGREAGAVGASPKSLIRGTLVSLVVTALASLVIAACGGSSNANGGSGSGEQLAFVPNSAKAGQNVTVRGQRLPQGPENTIVRASLIAISSSGEEIELVDNVNIVNGIVSFSVFVTDDLEPGEYTVEMRFKGDKASEAPVSTKFTVLAN